MHRRLSSNSSINLIQLDDNLEVHHRIKSNSLVEMFDPIYEKQFQSITNQSDKSIEKSSSSEDIMAPKRVNIQNGSYKNEAISKDDIFDDITINDTKNYESIYPSLSSFKRSFSIDRYSIFERLDTEINNNNNMYSLRPSLFNELSMDTTSNLFNDSYANRDMEKFMNNVTELHMLSLNQTSNERNHLIFDIVSLKDRIAKSNQSNTIKFIINFSSDLSSPIEPYSCDIDAFDISERELLLLAINHLGKEVNITNLFFRINGRGEYLKQGEFPLIQNQSVFKSYRAKSDMKLILENINLDEEKYKLEYSIAQDITFNVYQLFDNDFFNISRECIENCFTTLNNYRNDIAGMLREYRTDLLDIPSIDASLNVFIDKCKSLCLICNNIYTADIAQQICDLESIASIFRGTYLQISKDESTLSLTVESLIKSLDKTIKVVVQMIHEITIFCNCNFSVKPSQLCLAGMLSSETGSQSISKCRKQFFVTLNSICSFKNMINYSAFYLKLFVQVGQLPLSQFLNSKRNNFIDQRISAECFATKIHPKFPECISFNSTIDFDNLNMFYLPMETVLYIQFYGRKISLSDNQNVTDELIGWTDISLFDSAGMLKQGKILIGLWMHSKKQKSVHGFNRLKSAAVLQIELPEFYVPVKYSCHAFSNLNEIPYLKPTQNEVSLLEEMVKKMWLDSSLKSSEEAIEMLWKHRGHLMQTPRKYIALCLSLVSAWPKDVDTENKDFLLNYLERCYTSMKDCSLIEIIHLLGPNMPLIKVRKWAVSTLKESGPDDCISTIPWLIEALKYESNFNSSGIENLLLHFSIMNINFSTSLFWHLSSIDATEFHGYKARLLLGILRSLANNSILEMWNLQLTMVEHLQNTAVTVKAHKGSANEKKSVLHTKLEELYDLIVSKNSFNFIEPEPSHPLCSYRVPYHPGMLITKLEMKDCSYFNSFTLPLRIVFKGIDESLFEIMFKSGDDLRQDILVLQLFKLMDDLWTSEGLNLRMVHYRVMSTGFRSGLVELVGDCTTLRKIQESKGIAAPLTNVSGITEWLKCQNTTKAAYLQSVNNFLLTCAACCVSTYLLGIGDRHNDNIMIQTSGCLFHIDFAKILGDAQTFAGIKRDRVPFVLTQDMVHVLEDYQPQPDDRRTGMQLLIDKCCEAYNIIRKHWTSLISILSMAAAANIPGVNNRTIQYVIKMLRLDLSDIQASEEFTNLIRKSVNSLSTPVNFFFHNLAQMKYSSNNEGSLFTFTPKIYRNGPRILSISIKNVKKVRIPNKYYTYEIWVQKENSQKFEKIFRKYEYFIELAQQLSNLFPLSQLPKLGQNVIQQGPPYNVVAAEGRKVILNQYISQILVMEDEISQCDLMQTFFNSILSDEQFLEEDSLLFSTSSLNEDFPEIQLRFNWSNKGTKLEIFVKHARNLMSPRLNEPPNSYVKTYIHPGYVAKRKTGIIMKSCSPSFNDIITYNNIDLKQNSKIEISVWHNETLGENFCLGSIVIPLSETHSNNEKWYKLKSQKLSDSERYTSMRVPNKQQSTIIYSATMPSSKDRKMI